MTLFLFLVWLQMSGVGEIKFMPEGQYVQFPTDTGYIRCPASPGTLPLACKTSEGKEVTVGIVPRAADETDGKPPITGTNNPPKGQLTKPEALEKVDVPAVQVGIRLGCESTGEMCMDHPIPIYSCADKSRVLLTSEDGKKHCVKF